MRRHIHFIFLAFIGLANSVYAVTVRPFVIVTKPYVTLSDVFSGVEKGKEIRILKAPELGKTTTLSTRWLVLTAHKHGLNWSPQSFHESVRVTSASDTFDLDDISPLLRKDLEKDLKSKRFQLKIEKEDFALHHPKGQAATFTLQNLRLNDARTRFQVEVVHTYGNVKTTHYLQGRITMLTAIPVLKRGITLNEVIQAPDIEWIEMPASTVSATTVVDQNELIGAVPRYRPLSSHTPLRKTELKLPFAVRKGDMVLITAQTQSLQITSKGKALENAGVGDTVKVLNPTSHRILQATVKGPKHVEVAIPSISTLTSRGF